MTPKQVFAKLSRDIEKAALSGMKQTLREGLAIARQDSSGKWNKKRRQKAGYSYSRRDPNPPPQPLGVINKETGVFLAAWHVLPLRSSKSGDLMGFIVNDSDRVADLVDASGKPWLSRPIDKRVRNRIDPVFRFNIEAALYKALR